jgi:hypothetical protein
MKTFQLQLDPTLREDLLGDISPTILGFILVETVGIIVKDNFPGAEDPDSAPDEDEPLNEAEDHLLTLLASLDLESGILVEGELTEFNDEYREFITNKLQEAISAVTASNSIDELVVVHQLLDEPDYRAGYNLTVNFVGNFAVFSVSPALFPVV